MFRKYPSLTNHYMEADLARFLRIYEDDLSGLKWHVGEKIHGANISFLFQPGQNPVKFFSRNQEIGKTECQAPVSFYGAHELLCETARKMSWVQNYCDNHNVSARTYGELFGASVQKGVDYGNVKRILFYDVVINDRQQTLESFEEFMEHCGIEDLMVPNYGVFNSFKEAFDFNTEIDSRLLPAEPREGQRMIEGVVIKPYNKVLEDINGSLFYVKKKNEAFKEAQSVKKAKTVTQYTEEVNEWRAKFLSYLHPERLESVFSKEGRISSMKEIGKFIKLVGEDTRETFSKEETDFPVERLTKKEQSYIMNASREIAELLKQDFMKG